ncbi:ABC transporter substrate-binding protein [Clostridium vitabionis]|jgi:branched-chain amino acid transport system substrate-binding protein|uniref:ABC transporter substrate-binding protein n=1 Tax=Clostridium vitabionis TaxID=2784388 RepID=UPI00188A3FC2|nr:ABC transporter substrate-binding protein [Clostridium vitabionis]
MKMKKTACVVLAGAMAMSLAACGGSSSSTPSTAAAASGENAAASSGATWKIGGIGPITGGAAAYGQSVKNSMELAAKELNEKGGINGAQVEVNFQDDENDPEKSVNAYNTLKDWGMQILLGTVTSKPCIAVEAEAQNDNLFLFTPSGSAKQCITGDNAFRVCFADPDQGTKSAQYIAQHQLATKIGIIYDSSSEYSAGIEQAFVDEAKNQNLEVVEDAVQSFTADTNTDFNTQLSKMQENGVDLVFLPIYYQEASVILKQASEKNFKPVFFGCDGMDGILSVDGFDKSLAEGLMLLTPFSVDEESSQDYVKAYEDTYKVEPLQFGADAYDGMTALKLALEKADVKPDASASDICDALKGAMTEISFDGLTGKNMTWTSDGEPNKEPKAVMIKDGKYVMQD